jgi:hypothetical protein
MKPLCREFFGVVLVITTGLLGCGGGTSSTSDSSGFVSGVSPSKMLGSLSSAEVDGVCQAFDRFNKDGFSREELCQLAPLALLLADALNDQFGDALTGGEEIPVNEQVCRDTVNSCIQNPTEEIEQDALPQCPRDAISQPSCAITVAEWEECVEEQKNALGDFVKGLDCSLFRTMTGVEILAQLKEVDAPKCRTLEARCPGVFE